MTSLLLMMCRHGHCVSTHAAAYARSNCWRHQDERNHQYDDEHIKHQVLVPRHVECVRAQVTSTMPYHVINPPGGPLARVLRARTEDGRRGAHGGGVRAIVDDVTGTCNELLGADVTHAAEIDAVTTVLHARSVVHLISPDCQAQLRNSVIQRLYTHTNLIFSAKKSQ